MPKVNEMIDCIGQGKYISTLDLNKGYWQVPVEETLQSKTAFTTLFGLYASAYIDDVAIHSETWEDHLKQLKIVLERLRAANLTAKPKKCRFGMDEALYLGHVIGGGRVKPKLSKVQAVQNYPVPTNKSDIRSFLKIVRYYRKFI